MKLSFAYISAFLVPILVNAANAVPTAAPTPAKSDITSLTLPRAARKGNSSSRTIRRVREMRQASFISSRKNLSVQNGVRDGAADHRLSLAIVRPIAAFDGEALVKSFDKWEYDFLGSICLGTDSYDVDLIISFSRTFDDAVYPKISKAIEKVCSLHEKTNGWGGCIQSIKTFESRISVEEDLYNPSIAEMGKPDWQNWVNGPNRCVRVCFYDCSYIISCLYNKSFQPFSS